MSVCAAQLRNRNCCAKNSTSRTKQRSHTHLSSHLHPTLGHPPLLIIMADASDAATPLKINIKGPSDLKLSIDITSDQTVRQLKEAIEKQKPDVPADAQRLIYAGKVLKDDEALFGVQSQGRQHRSHGQVGSSIRTYHGQPPRYQEPRPEPATPRAMLPHRRRKVCPRTSLLVKLYNNPLSALNRADYAAPHMARLLNESGGHSAAWVSTRAIPT